MPSTNIGLKFKKKNAFWLLVVDFDFVVFATIAFLVDFELQASKLITSLVFLETVRSHG
jgi:hypothetical protein